MSGRVAKLMRRQAGGHRAIEMQGHALSDNHQGGRQHIVMGAGYQKYNIMKKSYKGLSKDQKTQIIFGMKHDQSIKKLHAK
jgi:hypothetical protein